VSKKKQIDVKKRKKEQSRRLLFIGICSVVFIIVLGFLFFAWSSQLDRGQANKTWSVDTAGKLSFTDRGTVAGSVLSTENGADYTLQKVVFKSMGDDVYALLRTPKNVTKPPVVVVVPAATISKEADQATAKALCDMGYAALTLDKRGQGETGGENEGDFNTGLDEYVAGKDPIQYKQVYDILKALDYVKSRQDLDGSNVALMGESRGGMWSVIAAGEEPAFKGVLTLSASDFDMPQTNNTTIIRYISSLMPSKYLENIPPRKLVMFQFDGDTLVPMADGKALYDKAYDPKAWHLYNGTTHGLYDKAIDADLRSELKGIFGR
jgi:dienelactone hydrolase